MSLEINRYLKSLKRLPWRALRRARDELKKLTEPEGRSIPPPKAAAPPAAPPPAPPARRLKLVSTQQDRAGAPRSVVPELKVVSAEASGPRPAEEALGTDAALPLENAINIVTWCLAIRDVLREDGSTDQEEITQLILEKLGLTKEAISREPELCFNLVPADLRLKSALFLELMELCFSRWPNRYYFQSMSIDVEWHNPILRKASMILFYLAEAREAQEEKDELALRAARFFVRNWSRGSGQCPQRVLESIQQGRGFGLSQWLEAFGGFSDYKACVCEGPQLADVRLDPVS